ncbi:MAG: hypothetical protein SFX72_11650 [Isosphaeraceae bacterium]|nr:hypothetical protein [Isosphaeraceae bacterium]
MISVTILLLSAAIGQAPTQGDRAKPAIGAELAEHLEQLQREVDDNSRPLARRVTVLLDMTAALDRAGQGASNVESAMAYWREGVRRIDDFLAKNGDREAESLLPLRLQAAVYLWEEGRARLDLAKDAADPRVPEEAARAALEDGAKRLRTVLADAKELPVIIDNARFRLAQALSDLAGAPSTTPEARRKAIDEAADHLAAPFEDPSLAGYAGLLRADLLRRNGKLEEAAKVFDAVDVLIPAPPEGERLLVFVEISTARNCYKAAVERVNASMLPTLDKAILLTRVRLAEHGRLGAGAERSRLEAQALLDAAPLLGSTDRLAVQETAALATAIDKPAHDAAPASFALVSEGHLHAGRPSRAIDLLVLASDRSKALGKASESVEYRLRAGAAAYRAGADPQVVEILQPLVADADAGERRSKASLLRILAAERGSLSNPPTVPRSLYLEALRGHLANFPTDATSDEARWRLGLEERADGRTAESDELWKALSAKSPRRLESQLVVVRERMADLVARIPSGDAATLDPAATELRRFLDDARTRASDSIAWAELTLRLLELELLPVVARPEVARELAESVLERPVGDAQKQIAKLRLVVALMLSGRVVDSETLARAEARRAGPAELLDAVRLLDRAASRSDSELSRIRAAAILQILLAPLVARADDLPEPVRTEVRFRSARASALAGRNDDARRLVSRLTIDTEAADDDQLRELADLYARVEADSLVIDVERLRTQRLRPGSSAWFEARYGLALAYFRARRPDDARKIIDATSILHPSLGGPALRGKFERLRLRLSR